MPRIRGSLIKVLGWLFLLGLAACRAVLAPDGESPDHLLYVAPAGNGKACSQASPCSLETANARLAPGDTAILTEGVYTGSIRPARSGTESSPITYQSESGRSVQISSPENGAILDQRSWVILRGLRFQDCGKSWIVGTQAQHILIEGNAFDNAFRASYSGVWFHQSSYITLRGNQFSRWGENALVGDNAGYGDAVNLNLTDHALIEDNDFSNAYAGHTLLSLQCQFGVVRGNRFANAWQKDVGLVGSTVDTSGNLIPAGPYLVEGNTFTGAVFSVYTRKADGEADIAKGGVGLQFSASDSIFRYNIFALNQVAGMVGSGEETSVSFSSNRIYQNTFYRNLSGPGFRLTSYSTRARSTGNVLLNNLFVDNDTLQNPDVRNGYNNPYGDHDRPGLGVQVMLDFDASLRLDGNFLTGNLFYQSSPAFTDRIAVNGIGDFEVLDFQQNPTYQASIHDNRVADPGLVDPTAGNFALRAGSPAIDSGFPQTVTTGSGAASTLLQVADARFFSDGWGVVAADWVRIGAAEPVQVASIDYATNTLTLAEPRNWAAGDPVSLARDSNGHLVLAGAAPDLGAVEFGVGTGGP